MNKIYFLIFSGVKVLRNALWAACVTLLVVVCYNASAQTVDYKIGTGTTQNTATGVPSPMHDYWEGDRHQFLYRASDLLAAGMQPGLIHAIKWDVKVTNNSNPQGWAMYIGTTTVSALTSTFQATPSIQVYGPAPTSYYPPAGINRFPLATPMFWNGVDNIIIQTCHGVGSGCRGYTRNVQVEYTTASYVACTYYQTDCAGNLCNQSTGSTTTNRPNVIFEWGSACPAKFLADPVNVTSCATDDAVFTAVVDSASVFQWQYKTGSGWVDLGNDAVYSGVNSLSLTVKNTHLSMSGNKYRMRATNPEKSCSVESDEGELIMIPSSNSSIVISAAPDTEICLKEEVTFLSAFTRGGATPQYRWLLNGLEIPNAVNATLKIDSLDHGDIIQCRFISSQQCVFESISKGVKFSVVSNLLAEVDVAVSYNGGNSYTFIANPKNGGSSPKYVWYVNGQLVPNETGQSFTTEKLAPWDKVEVGMLTSRDCAEPRLARSRLATTSVAAIGNEGSGVSVSPSPNKGSFVIKAGDVGSGDVFISIANSVGQVVYSATTNTVNGKIEHGVNLGSVAVPGMYMISVVVNGNSLIEKFVVTE